MGEYVIPEEVKEKAQAYNDKILGKRHISSTPNYTNLHVKNRFYTGYIGEWACERYFTESGISFEHQFIDTGKLDKGDFIINEKIYDVKTNASKYSNLLIAEDGVKRHYADYYISAQIFEDTVKLVGFISRREVVSRPTRKYPLNVSNYVIDYDELTPMRELGA